MANLILDPLFIFAFHLGIEGAAIATVISQVMSACFVVIFLRKKAEYKIRLLHREELGECAEYAKNIVSLGTSGFVMPLTNLLPYAFHLGTDGVFMAEPVSNVIGGSICFVTMLCTVIPELRAMEKGCSGDGT